ncbi:MAG: DUF3858 domain-containing protein [Acidobacteria bacterium]|nr:DUF3858 domain-containing protein [Acidobacteriota bacterium]MCB9398197.1 DUF3858 domain-containing protein [Acidobacteriota bacterium]
MLLFFFFGLTPIQATDLDGEFFANRFELSQALYEAKKSDAQNHLDRIGWFLSVVARQDNEATQNAGLSILREFPDSLESEFVLAYMKALRDQFPGWIDQAGEILVDWQPVRPETKGLRAFYLRLLASYQDDQALHTRALSESGYIQAWRYAPLYGQYPIPDFEREWPAEQIKTWSLAWPVQTSMSGVMVPPSSVRGAGVLYAHAKIKVEHPNDFLLRLYAFQNLDLYLDGKKLVQKRALLEMGPKVNYYRVTLAKGEHEFLIKLTQTRGANGQFSLQLSGDNFETVSPNLPQKQLTDLAYPAMEMNPYQKELGSDRSLALFLQGFYAQLREDDETALENYEALRQTYPDSQWAGAALANLYLTGADYLSQDERLGNAFNLLRVLVNSPQALPDTFALMGRLMIQANRPQDALQLFRTALTLQAHHNDSLDGLLALSGRENLIDVREQVKKQLEAFGPQDGWAQKRLLDIAKAEGNTERTVELLANLGRLFPWDSYLAEWYDLNENLEAAIENLKQRSAYFPESAYFPSAIANDYARLGDHVNQRYWLEQTMAVDPTNFRALSDLVDLDCYEGKLDQARARMQDALEQDPGNGRLRQMLSHLDGRTAFESFRVDSFSVVEKTLQRPTPQDADTELVLDQMMIRLFADGSQMRYTHLLRRVLTKAGVDEESEISLPEDVEILELRTIKPDGSVLYPADIDHKSSLTLSGVSVGDFIDEEHIQYLPPAYYDKDGADASMSFVFQGIDRIYHHSELVLIYPKGLDPEPQIFSKNFPFPLERNEENGLVSVRWLAKNMPPLNAEPAMPNPGYFLPTATFYFNTTYREIRDFFINAINTRMVPSRGLKGEMVSWAQEETDLRKRAEKVYAFVVDSIEPDQQFYRDINQVWQTKSGNAGLLLCRTFNEMGIPTHLVLTRPKELETISSPVPIPDFYTYGLLQLKFGQKIVFVDPNQKHLPFGYIPYEYRGAKGLLLDEHADVVEITLPESSAQSERITFAYEMAIDDTGAMTGSGSETFYGSFAGNLVERYKLLNKPEIKQRVEAGINGNYPGTQVQTVTIAEDQPAGEFQLAHTFSHPAFGVLEGQTFKLPRLLPETVLIQNYGSLAERHMPLHIRRPLVNEGTVRVTLNGKAHWSVEPKNVNLKTEFGVYKLTVKRESEQVLLIKRSYEVPDQLIAPENYPKFLEFLNSINENENTISVNMEAGT